MSEDEDVLFNYLFILKIKIEKFLQNYMKCVGFIL